MTSKPIVAPVKGDPTRASWGAAVAERANECADAIDVLRGPGGLASLREPKAGEALSLFPFKVRFERSAEEGAGPQDGDFLIYIPAGSLTVDGHAAGGADFALDAREGEAGWYVLPGVSADAEWWISFEYAPAEDPPLSCGVGTSPEHESPDDARGRIARSVHIADVEFPQAAEGETPRAPVVRQVTKGPLSYEFFVDSLNGMMGDLAVAADPDACVSTEDGDIYASVKTDKESGKILVGLTNMPPDEGGDGDADNCTHPGSDGEGGVKADYTDAHGFGPGIGESSGGGVPADDNHGMAIGKPCNCD